MNIGAGFHNRFAPKLDALGVMEGGLARNYSTTTWEVMNERREILYVRNEMLNAKSQRMLRQINKDKHRCTHRSTGRPSGCSPPPLGRRRWWWQIRRCLLLAPWLQKMRLPCDCSKSVREQASKKWPACLRSRHPTARPHEPICW